MNTYRVRITEHGWTVPQGDDKPQSYHCRRAIATEVKARREAGTAKPGDTITVST